MYNLIEYSDNYAKASGSLWQHYRDEPNCVISNSTGQGKLKITDTNLYVPVVTSSTKDNEKLVEQLKSGLFIFVFIIFIKTSIISTKPKSKLFN